MKDILTGIFLCLLMISLLHIFPLAGVFIWILLPLPVLFYRLKAGRKGSAIIVAACLGILAVFAGSMVFNLFYFGFFLLTGFFLGEYIERMLSVEKIILYTLLSVFGLFAAMFILYSVMQNQSATGLVSEYLNNYQVFSRQIFSETAAVYSQMDIDVQQLERINLLFLKMLPAILINSFLIMVWLNILYIRRLLRRKGLVIDPLENLTCWKTNEYFVFGLIATAILIFLPVTMVKITAANCLFILMLVYFLQGIAVISFFFQKKSAPALFRFFFYFLIAMQPLFMLLVSGLGLFDTWFNFRKIDVAT